ncbi:EP300-interacting inhibitor of differentiation 3 [Eumeta japonica]|uniref:Non-structural maintenance of chromosomes element 4 n=1 Tax=Eumeta variegata TaxID=151549 RepID=A0A4C1VIF9_EUMVA|nr:EP300-interacting inhibitor of differentiation 3 [Eumeta japonica]
MAALSLGSRGSGNGSYTSRDRKLRYKAVLDELNLLEEENNNNTKRIESITSAVKEAQAILEEGGLEERVRHPGESYLDSRVLKTSSDLAVRCSEDISGNVNTYDKHEFAALIRRNPQMWNFSFPKEVPVFVYLFGTFAPTPPEERVKVPRRTYQRQQIAALKRPETVSKLNKQDEGSELVSSVHRFISKAYKQSGQPLSYFHVVLDPTSFAKTVENIYHISFLVRDGLASVNVDDSTGLPFLTPQAKSDSQQSRDLAEENQFIVSIDMQRWQELIRAFRITSPMMVLKR